MTNEIQTLSADKIQLIRRTIAPTVTPDEFEVFIGICNRTGLDPFARQIYALTRRTRDQRGNWIEKMSVQTSIDGFRLIADRACQGRGWMRGNLPTEWTADGSNWVTAWVADAPPAAARYTVLVRGPLGDMATSAVARYASYCQYGKDGPTAMWAKMPELMIAKCAEALALRQSFPQELSGLYTSEEMGQATEQAIDVTPTQTTAQRHQPKPPNGESPNAEKAKKLGITVDAYDYLTNIPEGTKIKLRALGWVDVNKVLDWSRYGKADQITYDEMERELNEQEK